MNHPLTIQQTVEEVLSETLNAKIAVSGCGRTDAGVHASQFYFYFQTATKIPAKLLFILNQKTSTELAFCELTQVNEDAHVCLDAVSRTYDYFFHGKPDAILARTSTQFELNRFEPERVARALPLLLNHSDFREFCLTPDRHHSTIVQFSNATLFRSPAGERYRIRFVANRFLRGMIRVLVKDLLMIGNRELTLHEFSARLGTRARQVQVQLAPPQGLFLTGISYPYVNREPELPFCGCCDWERIT